MKLSWNGRSADARYELAAHPDNYDGTPEISSLYVDWSPLSVHDDILSVAAVLSFGSYISGLVSLPRKVSPEVAEEIENFLSPTWVTVSPIEFEPRANPIADGALFVSTNFDDWGRLPSVLGEPRTSTLLIKDSTAFSGAMASSEGALVASNAEVMGSINSGSAGYPLIAAALIYAETYHAANLILSPGVGDLMTEEEFLSARRLLQSCKVGLTVLA